MGWIAEVRTGGDEWSRNACVFETEDEATRAGEELAGRWLLVTEWRATEVDEPANYVFKVNADRPGRIE